MTWHIYAKTNCIGECEPKIQLDDINVVDMPAPDGVGGCAMCGAAYEDQVIRQSAQQVLEHAPCLGMNCGITRTDQVHSAECQAEHAAAIAGGKFVKPAQRKPLPLWTEAQHERAYRNSPELHKDVKSLAAFKRVAKEIAAMYGIKEQP